MQINGFSSKSMILVNSIPTEKGVKPKEHLGNTSEIHRRERGRERERETRKTKSREKAEKV